MIVDKRILAFFKISSFILNEQGDGMIDFIKAKILALYQKKSDAMLMNSLHRPIVTNIS